MGRIRYIFYTVLFILELFSDCVLFERKVEKRVIFLYLKALKNIFCKRSFHNNISRIFSPYVIEPY